VKRLCIPLQFRHNIIAHVHDKCAHYAAQSLFHTLSARYFWKTMFADALEYCKTCDTCQRTKINYTHNYVPLHPLPFPDEVGFRFSMDHKPLTRTTNNGNTAILVIVEAFSGFPHLIPIQDMTAETTARAIVHHIIPYWGIGFSLYSDKSPSFVNALFAKINQLLSIRHVTSAARTARSNGLAEAMVKRLSEHLKYYAKDDYTIEEVLPLIEMNLRATPHSKLAISPYEIVFARPMRIGVLGDPITTPSVTQPEATTDKITYYQWLSTELKRLHTALKQAREELKTDDKRRYDKYNKTVQPSWKVGDKVLLKDMQVKPGASKVITKQRFAGPFIM